MSDYIKVEGVRRYTPFNRLQTVIEGSATKAITSVLKEIHAKAVEKAPIRNEEDAKYLPEQVAAPGLLKNSIAYTVNSTDKLKGLNSYGGQYQVDEESYPSVGQFGGDVKKKPYGFVGSFVIHEDYADWRGTYTKTVKKPIPGRYKERRLPSGRVYYDQEYTEEKVQKKINKKTAQFPYAQYVEFNTKPFLRPAVFEVVDSYKGEALARVYKRDLPLLADKHHMVTERIK